MCLYPKLIVNPKYKENKKNGGVIPPLSDERIKYVPIACNKCEECYRKKSREWQIRLLNEIKYNKDKATFVTLTFSNEKYAEIAEKYKYKEKLTGYALDNQIVTRAVRLWLENYRSKYKKSFRHWLITEIGGKNQENVHLHGIIWGNQQNILDKWNFGYYWRGYVKNETLTNYVNEKTIGYITKYINKKDKLHKNYKPIILTSSGIGKYYTDNKEAYYNKYNGKNTKEYCKTRTGHKIALPIYWRNKIYTEEEREKLWINKLDEKIRYINGLKFDTKTTKGVEEFLKYLKFAQKENIQKGYGSDVKNWEMIDYENQLRNIKIFERLAKVKKKQTKEHALNNRKKKIKPN